MRNWKQVKQWFLDTFKGIYEVSSGISKIDSYLGMFAPGAPLLTLANTMEASANAATGIFAILSYLAEPSKVAYLEAEARFSASFHLLCHLAHIKAVEAALQQAGIPDAKTFLAVDLSDEVDLPTLDDTETSWNYDLDFATAQNELFNAYSSYYARLLEVTNWDSEAVEAWIENVNGLARENLFQFLTAHSQPYEWVSRYLQLETLLKTQERTDSLKEAIEAAVRQAMAGFLEKGEERSSEAWQAYRDYLRALPTEPIFGSDFGIERLYVLSHFTYYQAGREERDQLEDRAEDSHDLRLRGNLPTFLSHLISQRRKEKHLIFILGDSGIGKTSFAKVYAAALAKIEEVHPLFIPLKQIEKDANLILEISKALKKSPLGDAVEELPFCSNLVFILDGFDELAQGTRRNRGDFLWKLERFHRHASYQKAAIIVTGRHTPEVEASLPANAHVITLQPFDKNQIQEWSSKWNQVTGQQFDGTRFWQDEEAMEQAKRPSPTKRGGLHEMASLPLGMYFLAQLEASGQYIEPQQVTTSRSEIYRHLLDWCCQHHGERRQEREEVALTEAQRRCVLRVAGFCTMAFGSGVIHTAALCRMLEQAGLPVEAIQKNDEVGQTFAMIFQKVGKECWEFVHASFSEYLAAEYIGEALGRAIAIEAEKEMPEEERGRLTQEQVAAFWCELFSRNPLTPEVQAFLAPMLGDWTAFVKGQASLERASGLERLLEQCGEMYARFITEKDLPRFISIASDAGIQTTQALVNAAITTLILGSHCARSLSKAGERVSFNLERYSPGGWWKMYALLKGHPDFYGWNLLERILDGVSLDNPAGIPLPGSFCPGLTLPFVKIPKIRRGSDRVDMPGSLFDRADLRGINLSGADLSRASFAEANLSEANLEGVNLDGANLERAILDRARLDRATLSYAYLGGVSLVGANLDEASLFETHLVDANLNGAHLNRAMLVYAVIADASLVGAHLVEASLFLARAVGAILDGANLGGAILERAHLEQSSLIGANLERANLVFASFDGARLDRANLVGAILHGANLERTNLRESNLKGIVGWKEIQSLKLANVYGVRDAPDGFLDWARERGAVEIESDEEWEHWKMGNPHGRHSSSLF